MGNKRFEIMVWVEEIACYDMIASVDTWEEAKHYEGKRDYVVYDTKDNMMFNTEFLPDILWEDCYY